MPSIIQKSLNFCIDISLKIHIKNPINTRLLKPYISLFISYNISQDSYATIALIHQL